jgi:hypothetical protein
MFGQEATEVMEMTGFDPPNSYLVEAESHGMHYQLTYTFEERSDGVTTVTMEFIGTPISFAPALYAACVAFSRSYQTDIEAGHDRFESVY